MVDFPKPKEGAPCQQLGQAHKQPRALAITGSTRSALTALNEGDEWSLGTSDRAQPHGSHAAPEAPQDSCASSGQQQQHQRGQQQAEVREQQQISGSGGIVVDVWEPCWGKGEPKTNGVFVKLAHPTMAIRPLTEAPGTADTVRRLAKNVLHDKYREAVMFYTPNN